MDCKICKHKLRFQAPQLASDQSFITVEFDCDECGNNGELYYYPEKGE